MEVPFTIFALALRRVKSASRSDTAVECLEDRQAFQQRENEPSRISGKKGRVEFMEFDDRRVRLSSSHGRDHRAHGRRRVEIVGTFQQ